MTQNTYIDPYPGNGTFKSFTKTWRNKPYAAISPSRPELSAKGKVVFITGGGTGIGKATGIAFAQAGAKAVAIFGRRVEKLREAAEEIRAANAKGGTKVVFEALDLSKRESTDKGFAGALKQIGADNVNVFVSNASTGFVKGTLAGYDEQNAREFFDMNLMGAFNAIQGATPLLASDAKVLHISSGIGHIMPIPGVWTYAAVKAANTKMFDYLAAENPGWSVFNVQPGVVGTDINTLMEQQDEGELCPCYRCCSYHIVCFLDDSWLTKDLTVELPANFHVWLASPEAEFLKGKYLWVNWDVDELKAQADEIKNSLVLRTLLNGVPM